MLIGQNDLTNLEGRIKAEAFRLGFNLCGFTTPESPAGFINYENWLSMKQHAGMIYLESPRHRLMRQHPNQLMSDVKTIISLGWPYVLNVKDNDQSSAKALIAGYAAGIDYHLLLPEKLDQLTNFIQCELNQNIRAQGFTDSAPILEREIASRAGLGWIGKNSCLINPLAGSAFLLAELFINLPLSPDQPFTHDRCGSCHRCVDACPTSCILPDRTIDSSRCISYLTIENKGVIPAKHRSTLGHWFFGCDICQVVCPWNKNNLSSIISPANNWTIIDTLNILSVTASEFSTKFEQTALSRSKLKGLQRNALTWLGNNGKPEHIEAINKFLLQSADAVLLETANWSVKQINKKKNQE